MTEPQNPPNPQDQNQPNQNPTTAPDPKTEVTNFYEQLIQDSNRRTQEAEARYNQLVQQSVAQTQAPPAPIDVVNDPQGFMNQLRKEIKDSVAPLDQFRQNFERTQAYQINKNVLRGQNNIAPYWHILEPRLDDAVSRGQIADTSLQGLVWAVKIIMGDLAFSSPGALAPITPGSSNDNNNNNLIPPPNQRSAPPPAQDNDNKPALRDLTESEERVRRMQGLSKEDFLAGMENSFMTVTREVKK